MSAAATDSLFHTAFAHAAIGMALVGPEGQWLSVNESLCQIIGYTEEELRGRTFQQITHPDDLDLDLTYLQQLSEGRITSYGMEKRYFHKDGRIIWAHLSVSAARERDGTLRFFISQVEDITKRKGLELNLRLALQDRERLIQELESTLQQNQQLRDQLVTVCAWTNRIHHDGRWMSADEFLGSYMGLQLTHGISEEGKALFYQQSVEQKKDEALDNEPKLL